MTSFEEFEEPFDANEFVERLASTTVGGGTRGGTDAFDPRKLSDVFERTIQELKGSDKKMQGRISKLEELCEKEQEEHKEKAKELENSFKLAFGYFQELDDRINYVATKVVHLGDQLEGINAPRSRAIEAQELMKYFDEFAGNGELVSRVFNDQSQIHEAANIIQKLSLISQELPSERFGKVKERIHAHYQQVESDLIKEFQDAHYQGDVMRMKACAETLLPFKSYSQCIETFIEQSQKGQFRSSDVFEDVMPLVENVCGMVKEVFGNNAEVVMGRLVQSMHEGYLQGYVQDTLKNYGSDKEQSLKNLFTLYGRAKDVGRKLSEYKLGSDSNFLERLRRNLFISYTSNYVKTELQYLQEKSSYVLDRYYASIGHQKKERTTGTGFISHEIQKRIPTRMHAQTLEGSKQTFLSQERVAVTLLQVNKVALKRCELLSSPSDIPGNAYEIYKVLLNYLCIEHIDYALEMALQGLPNAEPRSIPETAFFEIVEQANAIFHLLEKHFTDCIIRLVGSSPVYSDCLRRKKEVMEMMESKLDAGLDRVLTSFVSYIKHILSTEQKKTDFKQEDAGSGYELFSCTQACMKTCQFIRMKLDKIRESLDGKNLESVLTEFGTRIHRVLFEHLQQFIYSDIGGMLALCDVNEYRKCMKEFKIKMLDTLFDTLYQLVNLLVVQPDNLKQVCSGEQLAMLDKLVLQQFVQLRADYRTAKLARHFV